MTMATNFNTFDHGSEDYGDRMGDTLILSVEDQAILEKKNVEDFWWYCPPKRPRHDDSAPEQIDSPQLRQQFEQRLAAKNVSLLEIPKNISRIIQLISQSDFSYDEISRLVSNSPVLTAEFLRIANSAMYNPKVPLNDMRTILPRLGETIVKSLLYLNSLKMSLSNQPKFNGAGIQLVQHCQAVATIARYLGRRFAPDADRCFMAGLLHDIGKLAILKDLSIKYAGFVEIQGPVGLDNLTNLFDRFNAKTGAVLAADWAVATDIAFSITHHGEFDSQMPDETDDGNVLMAAIVHISDKMARILGHGQEIQDVEIFGLRSSHVIGLEDDDDTHEYLKTIPEMLNVDENEHDSPKAM